MANAKKSSKNYDYVCRYNGFSYFYDEDNNRYYYGLTSYLDNDVSYSVYETKPGDTYDSIALDHYGGALYWWVICDFNRITDAFEPPASGTRLNLPSLNAVKFL